MKESFTRLFLWRPGNLARGTFSLTASMGLRSLAQAAVFVLIARVLGVGTYGAFAAVLAIASALGGFTGCGTQNLLTRDTARNPRNFPIAWGAALAAIGLSAPLLFLAYVALAAFLLPNGISSLTLLLLGLTELLFTPFGLAMIAAYYGHERIGRASRLVLMPVAFRLFAALIFFAISSKVPINLQLDTWSIFYATTTMLAAVYGLILVRKDLGSPEFPDLTSLRARLATAWPFALGIAATRLYSDIDKAMLARLASLEETGAYAAAYRIAELAAIPILSLFTVAMPTLFRKGEGSNAREVIDYSKKILPIPILYAALAGIVILLLSEFVPVLLGQTYSDTVFALRWLAWLPLISLGRVLLQRQLLGVDRQRTVAVVLAGGGLMNIALNFQLIPLYGWRGAVISTYAAEAGMTVIMAWLMRRNGHGQGR